MSTSKDTIIALVGSTGKAGSYILKELISRGYSIRALVRDPGRIRASGVDLVIGDVADPATVAGLVSGVHFVISALGMGTPPGPPTIFSSACRNIIQAMNQNDLQRYIALTGLNANTNVDNKGPASRQATEWMIANFPKSTADKQQEYELLNTSNLDYTLVRLPMIQMTDEKRPIAVSLSDCPGDRISAASLATFVAEQIINASYIRQAPFIADAGSP